MTTPVRISGKEACSKTRAGVALLVCGYENEEKFRANYLEGALSFQEFHNRLPRLPRDQEIIFYCA